MPPAGQQAVEALLGPADAVLLASPNNTLAVEYLRAIRRLKSPLTARTLRRTGAQHGEAPCGGFASASYLRQLLAAGETEQAAVYMPPAGGGHPAAAAGGGTPDRPAAVRAGHSAPACGPWNRRTGGGWTAAARGCTAGCTGRAHTGVTLADVLEAARTKRYPLARLRRMVLAAWLDLPEPPEELPYLRVLAANGVGRQLLRRMRDAGAPVLTKPADAAALGPAAQALMAVESRCTDLYVLARPDPAQTGPGQELRSRAGDAVRKSGSSS